MKKILLSLSMVATVLTPAFAFSPSDTAPGDSGFDVQVAVSPDENNVAAIPGAASAPQMNDSIGFGGTKLGAQLDFTDEQLEKIAKLKNELADNTTGKKLELRSLSRQLRMLLTQESVDRSQVLALQKKINDLHSDLATSKLTMRLDTLNIMTAEQRQKIHHLALQRQALGSKGVREGKHGGKRGMQGRRPGGKRGACPGGQTTGQLVEGENNISILPNEISSDI